MGHRRSVRRSVLTAAFLALLAAGAAAAETQDWPPVTDEDKAVKDCPGQPGAPAVYLLRHQFSNDNDMSFRAFFRLKVLTDAGKAYGDIEIPFSEAWRIKDIQARVVKPDGRAVPYTGPIFEKTVVQVGRLKRLVKTFALPDIEVGSIIDHRYELKLDPKKAASSRSLSLERWKPEEGGYPEDLSLLSYTTNIWDFTAPLYTFKARYVYMPYRNGQISLGDRSLRLAWVSYGLAWGGPVWNGGSVELTVDGIPARAKEEFMPPEAEDRMGVIFFFCDNSVSDAASYWRREVGGWRDLVREFLDKAEGAEIEAQALVRPEAPALENLKALYDRAQRIENLSYDPAMTPARRKELKIKDNRSVADVLKRGAGLRSDITRAFVALARAAGFKADLVRVASRDDQIFHEQVLSLYGQFDTEIAKVETGGRTLFFDPATPLCPMGTLPWACTGTAYFATTGPLGDFPSTPLDPPDASTLRRELDLKLDAAGRLTGSVRLTLTGQEALVRRLEYLDLDEAEARRRLETELKATLGGDAQASCRAIENLAVAGDPLRLEFDVSWSAAAAVAGGRIALPAVPLRGGWHDAFRLTQRRSSVQFRYLARETDDIVIALPEGMRVEALPAASLDERSFARHTLDAAVAEDGRVRVRRELTILKPRVPADQYPILRAFFDRTRAAADGQILLSGGER
ncbi:MAG: DUF3857 domain-containing protein [Acidobacteria bacterium]|jgi:hypothetical protein|nr:DUF3857 domain-containing protein [Acidobacteriota bacterium]